MNTMQRETQERIFREWASNHQGILVHLARGFADEPDQDDLLQEMLLALWHAVPRFRGEAAVATFIYRVAQNVALMRYRGRARRPAEASLDDISEPEAPAPTTFERSERLYAAIRRLPELDRALLLMHLDGIAYRDIADSLGITETNVGARLTRLRQRLARQLKENDHEPY